MMYQNNNDVSVKKHPEHNLPIQRRRRQRRQRQRRQRQRSTCATTTTHKQHQHEQQHSQNHGSLVTTITTTNQKRYRRLSPQRCRLMFSFLLLLSLFLCTTTTLVSAAAAPTTDCSVLSLLSYDITANDPSRADFTFQSLAAAQLAMDHWSTRDGSVVPQVLTESFACNSAPISFLHTTTTTTKNTTTNNSHEFVPIDPQQEDTFEREVQTTMQYLLRATTPSSSSSSCVAVLGPLLSASSSSSSYSSSIGDSVRAMASPFNIPQFVLQPSSSSSTTTTASSSSSSVVTMGWTREARSDAFLRYIANVLQRQDLILLSIVLTSSTSTTTTTTTTTTDGESQPSSYSSPSIQAMLNAAQSLSTTANANSNFDMTVIPIELELQLISASNNKSMNPIFLLESAAQQIYETGITTVLIQVAEEQDPVVVLSHSRLSSLLTSLATVLDKYTLLSNEYVYLFDFSSIFVEANYLPSLIRGGPVEANSALDRFLTGALILDVLNGNYELQDNYLEEDQQNINNNNQTTTTTATTTTTTTQEEDVFYNIWKQQNESFVLRILDLILMNDDDNNGGGVPTTTDNSALAALFDDAYFQTNPPSHYAAYIYDAIITFGMAACRIQSQFPSLPITDPNIPVPTLPPPEQQQPPSFAPTRYGEDLVENNTVYPTVLTSSLPPPTFAPSFSDSSSTATQSSSSFAPSAVNSVVVGSSLAPTTSPTYIGSSSTTTGSTTGQPGTDTPSFTTATATPDASRTSAPTTASSNTLATTAAPTALTPTTTPTTTINNNDDLTITLITTTPGATGAPTSNNVEGRRRRRKLQGNSGVATTTPDNGSGNNNENDAAAMMSERRKALIQEMGNIQFQGASGWISFPDASSTGNLQRDPDGIVAAMYNIRPAVIDPVTNERIFYDAPIASIWTPTSEGGLWIPNNNNNIIDNGADGDFLHRDGSTDVPPTSREIRNGNFLSSWARAVGFTLLGTVYLLNVVCIVCLVVISQKQQQPTSSCVRLLLLLMVCTASIIISTAIYTLSWDENCGMSDSQLDVACMATQWLFFVGASFTLILLATEVFRLDRMLQLQRGSQAKILYGALPLVLLFVAVLAILITWSVLDPWSWNRVLINEIPSESIGQCESQQFWAFFAPLAGLLFLGQALTASFACKNKNDRSDNFHYPRDDDDRSLVLFAVVTEMQAGAVGLPVLALLESLNASVDAIYICRVVLIWLFSISGTLFVVAPTISRVIRVRRSGDDHNSRQLVIAGPLTGSPSWEQATAAPTLSEIAQSMDGSKSVGSNGTYSSYMNIVSPRSEDAECRSEDSLFRDAYARVPTPIPEEDEEESVDHPGESLSDTAFLSSESIFRDAEPRQRSKDPQPHPFNDPEGPLRRNDSVRVSSSSPELLREQNHEAEVFGSRDTGNVEGGIFLSDDHFLEPEPQQQQEDYRHQSMLDIDLSESENDFDDMFLTDDEGSLFKGANPSPQQQAQNPFHDGEHGAETVAENPCHGGEHGAETVPVTEAEQEDVSDLLAYAENDEDGIFLADDRFPESQPQEQQHNHRIHSIIDASDSENDADGIFLTEESEFRAASPPPRRQVESHRSHDGESAAETLPIRNPRPFVDSSSARVDDSSTARVDDSSSANFDSNFDDFSAFDSTCATGHPEEEERKYVV